MPLKKIIRILRPRIKILYVLLLLDLYQFLHKRKADNTSLSNTVFNCSYAKLGAHPVKTIRSDVCWWPQILSTATTRKACQHRREHIVLCEFQILCLGSKERLQQGKLLFDGRSGKFHQNT
jgi:hypothetical protein